jgi:hypothetical protein
MINPHLGAPHHPAMWVVIGAINRIICGDVLQIPGDGIESQTTLGCYIA